MKKISMFLLFLLINISYVFANTWELVAEKKDIDLSETLMVKATLEFEWNDISFKDLNINDNFDIVSNSTSTSSNTQISIINWETKQISKNKMDVLIELKPLKSWKFDIWPATFLSNWKEIKTNIVSVSVEKWTNTSGFKWFSNEKNNDNSNIFYYILWIIILVLWLNYAVILRLKNKKEFENTNIWWKNKDKVVFFPEIDDEYFEIKLNNIFLDYLEEKYFISNIYSRTSTEILREINDESKDKIEEILWMFDTLKYSNTKEWKEKILEEIKKLDFFNN